MRIGIACSGLDHVRRGFETFAEDLFRHLVARPALEALLFKGNGRSSQGERVLWSISRDSSLWGGWTSPIPWEKRYFAEQATFALSLRRRLRKDPVDVLIFSDIQVGNVLRRLSGPSRVPVLLFSNGGPFPPRDYSRFDFIHQLTPGKYAEGLGHGLSRERMFLAPYGVDTDLFFPEAASGQAFRRSVGIGMDEQVILSVGALETPHKRMDWVIREVSRMQTKPHLILCGEHKAVETQVIRELGASRLGSRFHALRLPYSEMPALYNSADLFVLCSLREGFGRAFLEALACGVPVLHHADEDMDWIVGRGGLETDMTSPGALATTLTSTLEDENLRARMSREALSRALNVFSWTRLLPEYVEMFDRAFRRDGSVGA